MFNLSVNECKSKTCITKQCKTKLLMSFQTVSLQSYFNVVIYANAAWRITGCPVCVAMCSVRVSWLAS